MSGRESRTVFVAHLPIPFVTTRADDVLAVSHMRDMCPPGPRDIPQFDEENESADDSVETQQAGEAQGQQDRLV